MVTIMAATQLVLLSIVCFIRLSSVDACGGTFTSLTGTIQSPNFPNNYANGLSCVYVITAPENYRVTLTFTAFDLEPGPGCPLDYLEIRDGDSENSPAFGQYCGTSLPAPRRTFGNQMWVKLVTDGSVTGAGFRATYTSAVHPDSFFLITSSSSTGDIIRMDPDTRSNYALPMSSRLFNPIAVDYDPVEQTIYWTEVGVYNRIRSASLDGSGVQTVKDAGADAVLEGITVDPQSRLIFYTDAGNDQIVMMTMSTFVTKTVINSSLDKPRAIVVDTADGVMFWVDWGAEAKIERANYDGSDRRTVVSYPLQLVNALALDTANDRLYWVDAGTDMVEMSDLNGTGRTTLLSVDSTYYFFGLALFQDSLYITDWGSAGAISKSSQLIRLTLAGRTATSISSVSKRLNDIHAYYNSSSGMAPNGCGSSNGDCSVICIPLPGNSSKCECPDGQSLTFDLETCVDGPPPTTPTTTTTSTTATTATTTTTPPKPPTRTATPPPDNTTPMFPAVSVSVSASEPLPFDADGSRELTLTCHLDKDVEVRSYQWTMSCRRQTGNTCVFAPQPAEHDGKVVTCTVTLSNGSVATGALKMNLNYPPQRAPVIEGYVKDEVLQEGHILTMTCSVAGGKPLVTSVIFACSGHSDTVPDVRSSDRVQSYLNLSPLKVGDNGDRCVCTAEWKKTDWYRLSATVSLRVNGTGQLTDGTRSASNIPVIAGVASGGGVVVVIVFIIIVVVFIKRRDKRYDKPPKKRNRPEENPYTGLGAVSNIPVVFYKAFVIPEVNNHPIGVENGGYSNDRNSSIYAELDETAMEPSESDDGYMNPVQLQLSGRRKPSSTDS